MTKPLGYWSLDYNNPLIKDIAETWGDYLEKLPEIDAYCLIARIGDDLWLSHGKNLMPSPEAEGIISRLNELTENKKIRLLQAIVNK